MLYIQQNPASVRTQKASPRSTPASARRQMLLRTSHASNVWPFEPISSQRTYGHQSRFGFKLVTNVNHGWHTVVLVGERKPRPVGQGQAAHEQRRVQRVCSFPKFVSAASPPCGSKSPPRHTPKATTYRTHVAQSDEVFLEHERYSHHCQ